MGFLTERIQRAVIGDSDTRVAAQMRTMKGLREGDTRQLYLGLALSAIAYLQKTKPRKELLYRRTVPEGSALVIHHRRSGNPRLEIVKPPKRGRR